MEKIKKYNMKKINLMMITLMMCLMTMVSFGQNKIDTLDYELSNFNQLGKFDINYLRFEDGTYLGVGDEIKIGQPSGSNQSVNKSVGFGGSATSIRNTFTYIMIGKMGMATMYGVNYLTDSYKGKVLKINKIILHSTKNQSGFTMVLENPGNINITVLNLHSALEFSELINLNRGITSDEALNELKKAKDKLDLEIITQEEYSIIKNELSKYIK